MSIFDGDETLESTYPVMMSQMMIVQSLPLSAVHSQRLSLLTQQLVMLFLWKRKPKDRRRLSMLTIYMSDEQLLSIIGEVVENTDLCSNEKDLLGVVDGKIENW